MTTLVLLPGEFRGQWSPGGSSPQRWTRLKGLSSSSIEEIRLEQALRKQVSYTRKWPKCPWLPLLRLTLFSPGLHLWPRGEFPKAS